MTAKVSRSVFRSSSHKETMDGLRMPQGESVPMVRVRLLQSAKLLPQTSTTIAVKVCETDLNVPMVTEPNPASHMRCILC